MPWMGATTVNRGQLIPTNGMTTDMNAKNTNRAPVSK